MITCFYFILCNNNNFLAEYTFPYVKKRLRVCARYEIEKCPIQVAIEEMYQRVHELRRTIIAQPTDVKSLQLRLQVCKIIFILKHAFHCFLPLG